MLFGGFTFIFGCGIEKVKPVRLALAGWTPLTNEIRGLCDDVINFSIAQVDSQMDRPTLHRDYHDTPQCQENVAKHEYYKS